MTKEEQIELLIRIDERVDSICKRLHDLPCSDQQKMVERHEQQLKTHNKFLWTAFTSSIGAVTAVSIAFVKKYI